MNSRILGLVEAVLLVVIVVIVPGYAAFKSAGKHEVVFFSETSQYQVVQDEPKAAAGIDGARIASQAPGEWLSNGRTYSEQRFSPLKQIDSSNVGKLGVAWEYRTYSVRGLQATPLVAAGVMYITESGSKVAALDAKTGKQLWTYDPKVPGQTGRYACCDVVNRGVALWDGAVFVGTLDGRLVKLDAKTGKVLWS